jgi:hypothetical protein
MLDVPDVPPRMRSLSHPDGGVSRANGDGVEQAKVV